jgi:hypothetical protein
MTWAHVQRQTLTLVVVCISVAASAPAQSTVDLGAEAVRAVKKSALAREWNESFTTTSAPEIVASFHGLVERTSGNQVAPRISAQVGGDEFRLAPDSWRCAGVADHLRARCALEEQPYYVQVSMLKREADTAFLNVAVYRRKMAGQREANWLLSVVTAIPEGTRWRVISVQRVVR